MTEDDKPGMSIEDVLRIVERGYRRAGWFAGVVALALVAQVLLLAYFPPAREWVAVRTSLALAALAVGGFTAYELGRLRSLRDALRHELGK